MCPVGCAGLCAGRGDRNDPAPARRLHVGNDRLDALECAGRGNTIYDNYYGDPRVKPNHNLGPLEKGPFTAIKLVPGDLGTKGGILTDADADADADARALDLDLDGSPITGLYAAGNTSASVMGHTYPGPGSTIGPAVVFGYRAAKHATSPR